MSRSTLAEWRRRPGCPKRVRGGVTEYQWPDFNEWRVQCLVEDAVERLRPAPTDIDASKARKEAAQAELAELDLKQRRGELVEVRLFEEELARQLARVRSQLLSLPGKAAPLLVGLEAPASALVVLQDAVNDVLTELREWADEDDDETADEEGAEAA